MRQGGVCQLCAGDCAVLPRDAVAVSQPDQQTQTDRCCRQLRMSLRNFNHFPHQPLYLPHQPFVNC